MLTKAEIISPSYADEVKLKLQNADRKQTQVN